MNRAGRSGRTARAMKRVRIARGVLPVAVRRHAWLLALLGLTAVVLAAGLALKWPCADIVWDGTQYEKRCYTDLLPIYANRGLAEDRMPYVEAFNEYPVLTGLWMYLAALVSDDGASFLIVNAVGLSVAALAVTFLLYRLVGASARVLWWAAAPPLLLYAFHNWDLLAVLLVVAALYAHSRGRPVLSGVFLGLGTAAKLFPAFIVPIIAAELARRHIAAGGRPLWRAVQAPVVWRFGLAAVGTWSAVNLPFLVANPALWWRTYAFHAGRGPTSESHWFAFRFYVDRWGHDGLARLISPEMLPALSRVLLLLGVLVLTFLVLRGRLAVPPAALGVLCVFLIANQVLSMQYALWLVPFFALTPGIGAGRKVLLFVADLLVFLAVMQYFHFIPQGEGLIGLEQLAAASMLRLVALALLLYAVLAQAWRSDSPAAA